MVTVNGKEKIAAGQNLKAFLENEAYDLKRIVVEKNYEIIPRDRLEEFVIEDGDVIEVVSFVGGG